MDEYFLAADVSKGYADFIILDNKKNVIEDNFRLDDTYQGHIALHKVLTEFLTNHRDSIIYFAVESTGGLENNWLNFITGLSNTMNIKAARINPLVISASYKASLTRVVTDPVSARTIAEYMIAYPEKIRYNVDDPYAEVRRLWKFTEMLKKQRTQLKNQLHILLYTSLPFLVTYLKNGIPNWMLELLLQYPSAEAIAEADITSLAQIRYISKKKAQSLKEQANMNVGSAKHQSTSFLIVSTARQIIELSKAIKEQKSYLAEQYGNLQMVKLLRSFKGIGIDSAIGLIMNIVSTDLFPDVKKAASFFGVHPVYKQSGDGVWGFHMSKQGRASMRSILFMIAFSAIRSNPLIKEFYVEQLKKGKSRMSALGICMHKIFRIVYGMLKNNKPFDQKIDKQNRKRNRKEKPATGNNIRVRRFHKEDELAPISRRQNQKRKKSKQSQSDKIT
jgi:transposase